jgi:hypothetical protein
MELAIKAIAEKRAQIDKTIDECKIELKKVTELLEEKVKQSEELGNLLRELTKNIKQ